MRWIVTALFLLVGLINLLPVSGLLGAARLESLYGQSFAGEDLLLLMRHRAFLLGIVGGLLVCAAFRPALRDVAAIVGLLSMVSFLLLALPIEVHGEALRRVFWVDVVAVVLLVVAWGLGRRSMHFP